MPKKGSPVANVSVIQEPRSVVKGRHNAVGPVRKRGRGRDMTDTALQANAPVTGQTVIGTGSVGDYIELLKPRVMSLVVFSGFAGLIVAPGHLHPVLALTAILCIAVGAGASGA